MEPRRVEDIQREIYRQLALNGSYLTDAHPGSVIYSLTRSFAAASLTGDQLLYEISQDFFLSSARGKMLDYRAAEYGIVRRIAKEARGYVLVRPREAPYVVFKGKVFVEPITGVQFIADLQGSTHIPEEVEVKIPVVAVRPGKAGNLRRGTRLVPVTEEDLISKTVAVEIIVGTGRNLHGEVIGDLTGGVDEESDAQLRARTLRQIATRESCTEQAVLSLVMTDSRVNWATTHMAFAGHTQVWVELNSSDVILTLNDLTSLVETIRPVGTSISVHQIKITEVNFEVHFQKKSNTDFNYLNEKIEQVLWEYCYNLPYGEPLKKTDLSYHLKQITEGRFLRLATPVNDLFPASQNAFRPGDIQIKHDVY